MYGEGRRETSLPVIQILGNPSLNRKDTEGRRETSLPVVQILGNPSLNKKTQSNLGKPKFEQENMERVKRFELSTSSLARKRSSQLSYTRIEGRRNTVHPNKSQRVGPSRKAGGKGRSLLAFLL